MSAAVRMTFAAEADRDALLRDLADHAAAVHGRESVFTAFDVANGKPALVKMRPDGERGIEIEVTPG